MLSFTVFSLLIIHGLASPSTRRSCPFPTPSTIDPCKCHYDEHFRFYLSCKMTQDMDDVIMKKLHRGFGCQKEIFKFFVDLNGNDWTAKFDEETVGSFQLNYFHLTNFGSFHGNIKSNAFNGSRNSIKEIIFDSSVGPEDTRQHPAAEVETEAFSQLSSLKRIELGDSFSIIQPFAFSQLKELESLDVASLTIKKVGSNGFSDLQSLKVLDLSNQSITEIEQNAFVNLPNLTELHLDHNQLKQVLDDTILPGGGSSLVSLNLSHNPGLCRIGNTLSHLGNPDLVVDLGHTNVKYLFETSFKPFIETRKGKGYVDLSGNLLECGCNMRWLLSSNFKWTHLLRNTTCRHSDAGRTIAEQEEKQSADHRSVYSKVMEFMAAKFNDGELSDDEKKNATDIITNTQAMLSSSSFSVLGFEKGNLSSSEILDTLVVYRDSGNMTEEQSTEVSQLAVDTHVRIIQELSPLLGLNASSLDLSEAEYNHLMSRPIFSLSDPTPAPNVTHSPTKLEEIDGELLERACPDPDCPSYNADYGQMYRYYEKESGKLWLNASLVKTIELKGGRGPIVVTLNSLPSSNRLSGYIKITENDGTILFQWKQRNYNSYWHHLNGRSFSSRTKRITVDFQAPTNHRFSHSYLEWKFAGGHDTDPQQFCDCC